MSAHLASTVKQSALTPIDFKVNDAVWTFGRRDERLMLHREETENGVHLVVTDAASARSLPFRDLDRLVSFQHDMESFLVRTGWSLIEFTPERRSRRDRRLFPRTTERRRWWTDAIPLPRLHGR